MQIDVVQIDAVQDAVRKSTRRAVVAAGAGLALVLPAGGAGAAAVSAPSLVDTPSVVASDDGAAAADDFFVLVPGQSRRGLPPGVELDDSSATVAGGAWTPADGLLYVVTLGSSTCPRIPEPVARDTMAGAGLAVDGEVGDIDVTLSEPPPDAVCTADWVPTTTVVAAPAGTDHGGTVSLRIGGVGKTDLLPREAPGETGPAAWIVVDR
ncbi:hypothetical protein [Myceligenerans pegani]|uniref:Secreted protein n=1 Tax=Myceligenerans pegani TaxID=2776917 RepID=A0ABR9MTW6_9MICO|nr:hypothetical protein [Myceligenerans sp. TRM 65318]MBE1874818.1 hypothetical protein [Myceligenerans sp. TRM 65318]MBE3017089.1 hypothetical protein [Myceligenerans sp. TRM 65318]